MQRSIIPKLLTSPMNKLFVIKNADKGWHEKWTKKRNLCNFPHPFRMALIGPPSCGKTSAAQNVVAPQDPPFEELIVVHVDGDYSVEWDNCEPTEITDEMPDYKKLDGSVKRLIVFEDFHVKNLPTSDKKLLDRLFGYASTHKNTSVVICQQDPSAIPPVVRRMSNVFVLWRGTDMKVLEEYGQRMGLERGKLTKYFKDHIDKDDRHSAIWIDLTSGTHAPVRKNCFEKLER